MNTARRGRGRGRGNRRPGAGDATENGIESGSQSTFNCHACPLVFSTDEDLTNHKIMTHSELYDFECGQCDLVFETVYVLKTHFNSVHGLRGVGKEPEAPPLVPQNGSGVTTGSSMVNMENHVGRIEAPTPVMASNGSGVVGGSSLVNSTASSSVNEDASNDYDGGGVSPDDDDDGCTGVSGVDSNQGGNAGDGVKLVTKIIRNHATGIGPYTCSDCGESFATHRSMTDHLRRHNQNYRHFCEVVGCGKGFIKKQDRDRHEIRAHVPLSMRPKDEENQCSICGKFYTQKAHLKDHMKVAHSNEEKPIACKLCDKRFWKMSCLKTHMMSIKHGGTGVSFRNKKKPKKKKTEGGGVSRRGRPRKVPEKFAEAQAQAEEDSDEDPADEDDSDDEYVPPGENKPTSMTNQGNNQQAPYTGVANGTLTRAFVVPPSANPSQTVQPLLHQQPQRQPGPQLCVVNNYNQNTVITQQQENPNIWRNNNVQQQPLQPYGFYGNQQAQQQIMNIPVGGLTLQDAFQIGYGIGGNIGSSGGS